MTKWLFSSRESYWECPIKYVSAEALPLGTQGAGCLMTHLIVQSLLHKSKTSLHLVYPCHFKDKLLIRKKIPAVYL